MSAAITKRYYLLVVALLLNSTVYGSDAGLLLKQGWAALIRDNDTQALALFSEAYLAAAKTNDTLNKAEALLYMGICRYSTSYSQGLSYCYRAMNEYRKLERSRPAKALEGRSRGLQLISTIKGRQGKYEEVIKLSREAMQGFTSTQDSTGTLGLIYYSLGNAYQVLGQKDSSVHYFRMALEQHLHTHNFTYLPGAYIKMAAIEANAEKSRRYLDRALAISDSTGNRQAKVFTLLEMGNWHQRFYRNQQAAGQLYHQAASISEGLSDKAFSLKATERLLAFYKETGDYQKAMAYQEAMTTLRDSIYSWDRRKEIRNLEIQYDVAEKERRLNAVQKEKEIVQLTNYLLWGGIGLIIALAGVSIAVLRRVNRRDKLLLETKEALVVATEQQKRMREEQMQQELEFKESQLSAMALQMLQKNELMQELKDKLEQEKQSPASQSINKIITKGLNHDKEWSDFNTYFESINKNFYTRLKQAYPDISPNDLKICALIRLNMSIKEMAGILNISPDSVKTARYRLRKKLHLNTEDNLADFIMSL